MSDQNSPYQSPATDMAATESVAQNAGLTANSVKYLKEASPWITFLGILGYIGVGFMIVCGAIMGISMTFASSLAASNSGLVAGLGWGLGLFYIALGVLYFFPARFTYRFGRKLRDYTRSGNELELEQAFRNNKSLWKFMGVMMIVFLCLIPVFIIIFVVIAAASASGAL